MSKHRAEDLSELSVVGVNIGKDLLHLVGFDAEGNRVLRRKINLGQIGFFPTGGTRALYSCR